MKPKPTNLGRVLKRWRIMSEKDIRKAAQAIGISSTTFYRLELGHLPDIHTTIKLLTWLISECTE